MLLATEEVLITLIAGTVLLLFLVIVIITAATRYQNRKRIHLMDMEQIKHEMVKEILKARLEAQEETLNQISRELHDNIGQLLSSAKILVAMGARAMPTPVEELQLADETISKAIGDLRALSKSLNKEWLEKFNFIENLNAEAKRINSSKALEMVVNHPEEIQLTSEHQLVLFRIVQESFQNSLKHGQATLIKIEVHQLHAQLEVKIEDNGKGFDVTDTSLQGVGMINIKNRTQLLGGRADWKSSHLGTSIKIQIPTQLESHAY